MIIATKAPRWCWDLVKDKDHIPDGVYHFAGEGAQEVCIHVRWNVFLIRVGGEFYDLVWTGELATTRAQAAWAEVQCQE